MEAKNLGTEASRASVSIYAHKASDAQVPWACIAENGRPEANANDAPDLLNAWNDIRESNCRAVTNLFKTLLI
jgi:hypothetical protein